MQRDTGLAQAVAAVLEALFHRDTDADELAPASLTMSHRPRMASPRAMKSSMMRTLSEALSHSLETSSVTFFL